MTGFRLNTTNGVRCLSARAVLAAGCFLASALSAAPGQDADLRARRILDAAGVKGGLIVHVGCSAAVPWAELTAALRASDSFLVRGLDTDASNVARARRHIRSLGLYGQVSIDRFSGERLPFADNVVNLLVVDGQWSIVEGALPAAPRDSSKRLLAQREVLRVLCPGGVAIVSSTDVEPRSAATLTKPWPDQIDEWTHFLHGPDGNAVAQDSVVGPPEHVQWIGAPKFSRSHTFMTSINAMVSANGRLVYIVDEGPAALPHSLPARWRLVARDAFNGVVLWKRPLAKWQPFTTHGRIPIPPDLFRRLVMDGDEAYVTLSLFSPVTALSAATGETLRTYERTANAEEIVCAAGILYVFAGTTAASEVDRRALAEQRDKPDRKRLLAIRARTGEVLWTKDDADTIGVFALSLAVGGGRVVFVTADAIVCLNAADGAVHWRHARPNQYARSAWSTPAVVLHDNVILCADRLPSAPDVPKTKEVNAELIALDAESGQRLWTQPCAEGVRAPADVFVVDDTVWLGEQPSRQAGDYRTGYDVRTGEVKRRFEEYPDWVRHHHHRCYRNKATERFILAGRTGVEFIDLGTGELLPHHFARGVCRYGVLPCNGLLYLPPSQCACYVESKLNGFFALAAKRQPDDTAQRAGEGERLRLERGPAYAESANPAADRDSIAAVVGAPTDWPTYRRDNARSGRAVCTVAPELQRVWSTQVGGKLTSLVCAGGKLFGASVDEHVVFCLDTATGTPSWEYVVGGRVDSPPTIAQGLAVFGCRDGWIYALRAADGELAWRFRAAPEERCIVVQDQVESVWPVHGSVLVENGFVYCLAGRSSYVDGGIYVHKLRLRTGAAISQRQYYSRDPETGRHIPLFAAFKGDMQPEQEMPGLLPDILSSDAENLFVRGVALGRDLAIREGHTPHLFSSMGFLDDTWWERTYWIYGGHFYAGCNGQWYARTLFPAGRIMAFDDTHVYGFRDRPTFRKHGLFQVAREPERIPPKVAAKPGQKLTREEKRRLKLRAQRAMKFAVDWHSDDVPIYARAMVLADNALFVAGPPRFDERAAMQLLGEVSTDDEALTPPLQQTLDSFGGREGSLLCAVDRSNGTVLTRCRLDAAPVFDGMIAADGRLFMASTDGKVQCFGKVKSAATTGK